MLCLANPAIAMPGLLGNGRLTAKQAVAYFIEMLVAVFAERGRDTAGDRAVRFDQRPLDLDSRHVCRQPFAKSIRCSAQLRPEFRQLRDFCAFDVAKRVDQCVDPSAGGSDNRKDPSATKLLLQRRDVDSLSCSLRCIRHCQCDDNGHLEFHHLLQQVQSLVEVGCADNGADRRRARYALDTPEYDIHGNALLERLRTQRKGPGEIDELQITVTSGKRTGVPLERNPRIITGLLPQTGEPIEQRAFAAVRISDDRNRWPCPLADRNAVRGDAAHVALCHLVDSRDGEVTRVLAPERN